MWRIESDTETMVRDLLARPFVSLPARQQKIGSSDVSWWEGRSGAAVIMATGGSCDDRTMAEQVVKAQLELFGLERVSFRVDGSEELRKTGGWPDIMSKAKRLIQSGNVTVLRNGMNNIVGHVIGDHGEYTTEIGRDDPSSRSITTWTCECPWDQYAWQRTRKWKKYEGRPCAHVMALYWKSLATPIDDYDPEQHGDLGTGQKMGPPEPAPSGGGGPGVTPALPPGAPPTQPTPTPAPPGQMPMDPNAMAPPAPPGILPPSPMDQLAQMQPPMPGATPGGMPSPPGSVSIPGAKMQTPFNPIQYPGGTYSKTSQYEKWMKDIAQAYANAPAHQPEAVGAWQELAEDSRQRADEIRQRLNVSETDHPEPYSTPQEMFDDINRGNFKVSRANSEHPIWTPEQNVNFRIVHDVLGHHPSGADFTWAGENKACGAHSPLLSEPAQNALFSECIGQTAYANQYGGFGPQKASFIHEPFTNQQAQSSGGLCHRHIRHGLYRLSKVAAEFQPPEIVRLKNEAWGVAEGKSEEHGAGQYQPVPEGSTGEVLSVDQSTGWTEVIFPLEGGELTPYHVKCFLEPSDLEATRQRPPGPFIKRRS